MKHTAILLLNLLISFTAYGQTRTFQLQEIWTKKSGDSTITKNLVTKIIPPKEGMKVKFSTPIDTARLFLPDDGKQYMFEGTWKLIGGTTPISIQALNYGSMQGINRGSDYIGSTDLNDYVQYSFTQPGSYKVSATFSRGETSPATGGKAEVRVNSLAGTIAGILTFRNTGTPTNPGSGWGIYVTEQVGTVIIPAGVSSIYLKFITQSGNGNFKSFTFTP